MPKIATAVVAGADEFAVEWGEKGKKKSRE